jgi:hypothetical protein
MIAVTTEVVTSSTASGKRANIKSYSRRKQPKELNAKEERRFPAIAYLCFLIHSQYHSKSMTPKTVITYFSVASLMFAIGVAAFRLELVIDSNAHISSQILQTESVQKSVDSKFSWTYPRTWFDADTVGGKLEVIEVDSFQWQILLNGTIVDKGEGLPPKIVQTVPLLKPSRSDVVVFTLDGGTICEFGKFFFVQINPDGGTITSEEFGNGFAYPMEVKPTNSTINVTIKSGHENNGLGILRGGNWQYKNGRVRRTG